MALAGETGLEVGAPLDLYRDPANTFVAGFLGSPRMNLIPAEVLGVSEAGLDLATTRGMEYNPLTRRFRLTDDTSVNYLFACRKRA